MEISHAHTGVGVEIGGLRTDHLHVRSHAHTGVGVEITEYAKIFFPVWSRPHGRGSRNADFITNLVDKFVTPTRAWE